MINGAVNQIIIFKNVDSGLKNLQQYMSNEIDIHVSKSYMAFK